MQRTTTMYSISSWLGEFGRRHLFLMTLATLTLAVLATFALLRNHGSDPQVIVYQGF